MRIQCLSTFLATLCLPVLIYSPPAAALDCTFGEVPFDYSLAEPMEGDLTSDLLNTTPVFQVIEGLSEFTKESTVTGKDMSCNDDGGSLELQFNNVQTPPAIGTTSYNGSNYNVYPTNEPWAGFIVVREDNRPLNNSGVVRFFEENGVYSSDMSLNVRYVKLNDPLQGTVGQLAQELHASNLTFDIVLPDGRSIKLTPRLPSVYVNILGVVCNLNVPAELDFGDITITDIKQPASITPSSLKLEINCGSGFNLVGERVPDGMQIVFDGGTETGLLDTDQDNVKYRLNDRLNRPIRFHSTYEGTVLTDSHDLSAQNTITLSVKPHLKDPNGEVSPGETTGNLGIKVIYK